jgi:hypothetical protein
MNRPSLAALLTLLAATALVAVPSIMSLLPAGGAIPGWTVVPGADKKGCTAPDFYSMYDGAAPDMMHAGLIAAGQRVYQRDNKRLTVDLFRFASWQQTKGYYVKRRDEISALPDYAALRGPMREGVIARSGRTLVCYLWAKQYCASLSLNATSPTDAAALRSFATAIAQRLAASP